MATQEKTQEKKVKGYLTDHFLYAFELKHLSIKDDDEELRDIFKK